MSSIATIGVRPFFHLWFIGSSTIVGSKCPHQGSQCSNHRIQNYNMTFLANCSSFDLHFLSNINLENILPKTLFSSTRISTEFLNASSSYRHFLASPTSSLPLICASSHDEFHLQHQITTFRVTTVVTCIKVAISLALNLDVLFLQYILFLMHPLITQMLSIGLIKVMVLISLPQGWQLDSKFLHYYNGRAFSTSCLPNMAAGHTKPSYYENNQNKLK